MSLNDHQLMRFSRQIMLSQIDVAGQLALSNARIVILGLGGLGCPAALYLASSGVGELVLVDGDKVEESNLHRQILHRPETLGWNKARSAAQSLAQIAPDTDIQVIESFVDRHNIDQLIQDADVVLDCTDNFATRYLTNQACVKMRKPLVSGAAIRFEGHLTVVDARIDSSPCYQCLYPETEMAEDTRCSTNGVIPPIVGMIGNMQALEAIKLVTESGERAVGKLMICDGLHADWRVVRYSKNPVCPICGSRHED